MTERIRDIYEQQTTAFKLKISLGFILRNIEILNIEYRYCPQHEPNHVDTPSLNQLAPVTEHGGKQTEGHECVGTFAGFQTQQPVETISGDQHGIQCYPHPISLGYGELPDYVVNCKGLLTMHKNTQGHLY